MNVGQLKCLRESSIAIQICAKPPYNPLDNDSALGAKCALHSRTDLVSLSGLRRNVASLRAPRFHVRKIRGGKTMSRISAAVCALFLLGCCAYFFAPQLPASATQTLNLPPATTFF